MALINNARAWAGICGAVNPGLANNRRVSRQLVAKGAVRVGAPLLLGWEITAPGFEEALSGTRGCLGGSAWAQRFGCPPPPGFMVRALFRGMQGVVFLPLSLCTR